MARVVVIGAGIIGLACAHALVKSGHSVCVLDRDPKADKASFGNAGGIALGECMPAAAPGVLWKAPKWLLDPQGPLHIRWSQGLAILPWLWRFHQASKISEVWRIAKALAALNQRTYEDLAQLMQAIGLGSALRRSGALAIYRHEAAFRQDQLEWQVKAKNGVEFEIVTGAAVRELEPALDPTVALGVVLNDWYLVDDPKEIVVTLGAALREQGGQLLQAEASDIAFTDGRPSAVVAVSDERWEFDHLVVAGGAWSGALAEQLGDKVLLQSERGYNSTIAKPAVSLSRELIFAEEKFVATPLASGLRIGGAAEFAGLSAPANYKRSKVLAALAQSYLPELRLEGVSEWMGQRPTTPDSLPVIGPSTRHNTVFYAFGHGHLGLTQAATTGRLIADQINQRPPLLDLAPYSIGRFSS